MYSQTEKPWDFLDQNSHGMFDDLTEQIQKNGIKVFLILLMIFILIILVRKYRK